MGPNLAQILGNHWNRQRKVPKVGKCLGTAFGTVIGVNQGKPVSPMIFNIMVDAVVQAVLEEACSPQEANNGMGWVVGDRNLIFYADDGRIVGRYHEWLQDALDLMVAMFI